ncbi:DUF6944 family repetitive protein [Sporolactobacillus terrae]|uniref:Uncharacterized protein n=1 Tax=Sporolactobacillus terrae TaxID=269673 RepID=A0A410DC92_9BACL|nr:hypothetical protein [Sporolactobacillus terrae]QAA23726.1 hypothetical protein C0674_14630 [Sporolactobacillus terrae]QAA26698.1 hypothetical protein C0679_14615 [Sporolactobacillus terrae]UAK15762.1 hypothetical protein K7399_12160 [Sporolactobacillus terrae]BBO00256.1 hypothetical protein St703_29600 [Sporolactobacillus terrae]
MDEQIRAVDYAFINALGTISAAIGATPSITLPEEIKNGLDVVGNALQATGNGLDANISEGLDAVGGTMQSFGNGLVIYGDIAAQPQHDNLRTTTIGNMLQALGGSLSLQSDLETEERNRATALSIIGNLLQIAGNSLQAVSTILQINQAADEAKTDQVNATGSWVQATGASLSFLAAYDRATTIPFESRDTGHFIPSSASLMD